MSRTTSDDVETLGPGESTGPDERLGRHIRSLRRARGLTLTQVAERASLSHPFLSQLERGLARPSMTSLERIARALGTSRLELIAATDALPPAVEVVPSLVRAHEGVVGPYAEGTARMLVTGPRRFEPLEFLGDNTGPGDFFVHLEEEFLTVLSGAVQVDLGDFGSSTLRIGDSLYVPTGTPHRWFSADGEPFRLLIVKERMPSGGASDDDGAPGCEQ